MTPSLGVEWLVPGPATGDGIMTGPYDPVQSAASLQLVLDMVSGLERSPGGIEAMGMNFVVDADYRLPQLNSVTVPEGVEEDKVRAALLNDYNLEIGAGLGALAGKVWRIGLMGESCCKTNVLLCLGALDAVLSDLGAPVQSGVAVQAAMQAYAQL